MKLSRIIFAIFIVIALAATPLSSALALNFGNAMAGMDCDQKLKNECPCCDAANACPPQFCLTKCFRLVGEEKAQRTALFTMSRDLLPSEPDGPSGWTYGPQPPPPRA